MINRWRKVEDAGGRRPNLTMMENYSETKLMLPVLLRYSKAL